MTLFDAMHEAQRYDERDPLRAFRDRFYTRPGEIYMDGNSLGLLSIDAEASVLRVLNEWKMLGIAGWTNAEPDWFTFAETLSAQVAPLVGADADEVIVTGSTTVNLHQMLATLYAPTDDKRKILADALNFPSDIFALQSFLRGRGANPDTDLYRVASHDGRTIDEDDIVAALETGAFALALLPSVVYTSGQLLDMARVTRAARENGAIIGWDLSHSVGVVPHELSGIGADFAVWCSYKYLNAGPGAVGGLYVNRRHFDKPAGLAGWWGSQKDKQFAMTHTLTQAQDAGGLQVGTPHLLSLAPLEGSLRIVREAGIERIREKSLALTAFLRELVTANLGGVEIATPSEDARRGGHLALVHPNAAQISVALRRVGVVPDFRPPDIVRLAPVPLYTRFADCVEAVARFRAILEVGDHRHDDATGGLVT